MPIGALLGGALAGATTGAIFGGFAPFPNSIMIPFMGAQSAVLAYNFGIYYELGKRTVKSLDNDFFNKIRANSTDEITLVTESAPRDSTGKITGHEKTITIQYKDYISYLTKKNSLQMITDFRNIIPDFQSLQNDIIEQTVVIETKKAARTPSAAAEIIGTLLTASDKELNQQYAHWNDQINQWHKETFGVFDESTDKTGTPSEGPGPDIQLEHKDIIGHEKHPEHPGDDKEPEPEITLPSQPLLTYTMREYDASNRALHIEQRWKSVTYTSKTKSWWKQYIIGYNAVLSQLVQWGKGNTGYLQLVNMLNTGYIGPLKFKYQSIFKEAAP